LWGVSRTQNWENGESVPRGGEKRKEEEVEEEIGGS